jgi:RNA polymerase sigma-70 factor (ECF subfamily)
MIYVSDYQYEEEDKLSSLYATYAHTLWYVAIGYLKDNQLAEDMVQDTFIKVSEHLDCIEDVDSKMTKYYLITIIRHKCIDFIRKKNRTQETFFDNQENYCVPIDNMPLNRVIRQETFDEMKEVIMHLDDNYRIPLSLRYLQGMSNVEISNLLDISVNLVAVRINRAKKMVQVRMEETAGSLQAMYNL